MKQLIDERELEERLRHDSRTWGGEPSPAASARLAAALPERRRRALRAAALAALIAAAAIVPVWFIAAPAPPPPAEPRGSRALDIAIAPLQRELSALHADAHVLAGALWQGVPRPLRGLFGE
jgi:hypothetical protein